jgi:hypothetical protein
MTNNGYKEETVDSNTPTAPREAKKATPWVMHIEYYI